MLCYALHSWSHPTRPPRYTTGLRPRVSEMPSLYPPTPFREARYESRHPAVGESGRQQMNPRRWAASRMRHRSRVARRLRVDITAMHLNRESTQYSHGIILILSSAATRLLNWGPTRQRYISASSEYDLTAPNSLLVQFAVRSAQSAEC